jgi:iron complex transport system substrate-binding protein
MNGRFSLTLICVGILVSGCRPAPSSRPARTGEYLRLLSTAPNVTEICCALGLRDCLVGRTRYCTYPPGIEAVPSIGALNDLNAEALVRLSPDLVLVSGTSRAIVDRLSRLALRYEAIPDVSLADLFAGIEGIGALADQGERARQLVRELRADLAAVASRHASEPRARVLILTAALADPPSRLDAAGPGSFYDDLLRLAGQRNVLDAHVGAFPAVALEYVLRADPDVIIELTADPAARPGRDADALRAWARVGSLKAVTQRHVHVLVGDKYFVLGPRIAETFEALCECIAK